MVEIYKCQGHKNDILKRKGYNQVWDRQVKALKDIYQTYCCNKITKKAEQYLRNRHKVYGRSIQLSMKLYSIHTNLMQGKHPMGHFLVWNSTCHMASFNFYWLAIISDNWCCDEFSTTNDGHHILTFSLPHAIPLPGMVSVINWVIMSNLGKVNMDDKRKKKVSIMNEKKKN